MVLRNSYRGNKLGTGCRIDIMAKVGGDEVVQKKYSASNEEERIKVQEATKRVRMS